MAAAKSTAEVGEGLFRELLEAEGGGAEASLVAAEDRFEGFREPRDDGVGILLERRTGDGSRNLTGKFERLHGRQRLGVNDLVGGGVGVAEDAQVPGLGCLLDCFVGAGRVEAVLRESLMKERQQGELGDAVEVVFGQRPGAAAQRRERFASEPGDQRADHGRPRGRLYAPRGRRRRAAHSG